MTLERAIEAGGKVIQLKTEIVDLIEKVRELLQKQNANTSLSEALIEIYRTRSAGESANKVAIDAIIANLDLPLDEVLDRLEKLKGYLVQIVDRVEPFILPLSTAGELLDLPLGYDTGQQSLGRGDVAFSLGGNLGVALTVSSFPAASPPDQWTGPIDSESAVQSLSLLGKIGIKASASSTFSHGGLSFSSAMRSSGRVNLYFQYSAATPRVAALVNSSNAWAAPWDLDDLAAKLSMVSTDGKAVGFRRIQVHGEGSLVLAGGVQVGRVLSYETTPNTLAGPKTIRAEAKLAAQLNFSFSRDGSFTYVVEKDQANHVTVSLNRSKNTKTDRSIQLGADIQVNGLNDVAKPYVDRFFSDDGRELMTKLEDWSKPGDRLVAELSSDLQSKNPAIQEIGQILLGQKTGAEVSQAAIGKLEEKIREQLNETIPFWGESSGDVANQLVGKIASQLNLGAEVSQVLNDELQPKLVEKIDAIHTKFEGAVMKLVPKGDALEQFLKPFEDVGEKVDELREKVDQNASEIIAPAIKLLKRYQDIRSRIYAGLQKAAQFKIGMAYAATISRESRDNTLLKFRVKEVNATTRSIHRMFLLGRLNSAWSEFRRAGEQGWIDNIDGSFGSFARNTSTVSFSLHFGDIGVSMTRVKAHEVDVQVGPSGNVLVATQKISQENVVKAFHVERSVGFDGAYDLAAAAKGVNPLPTPLGFNLAYEDKHLKTEELQGFLGSLEQLTRGRRLLPEGASARAVQNFNRLRQQLHGGSAQARIDVTLPVGLKDLAKLITIRDDRIEKKAIALLIEMLIGSGSDRSLLNSLCANYESGISEMEMVKTLGDEADDRRGAELLQRKIRDAFGGANLGAIAQGGSPVRRLVKRLQTIARDAEGLINAVNGIRAIAAIQKEIAQAYVRERPDGTVISDEPGSDIAEGFRQRLVAVSSDINDGLDSWLQARDPITGIFTEAVPEVTLALLGLIAELSGDTTTLVPVVSVTGVDEGQIAVV